MADKVIVKTKLCPPRCQDSLLAREKLFQRLKSGYTNPLTLITGGGGYGKTTLAVLWSRSLTEQKYHVGWFGISPADDDLSQFVTYFAEAINKAAPGVGQEAIALFNHGSCDAHELFIAALINDIQQYQHEIYITLDDYHHIKSPAIHQLLQELLAICPENFHLVILSRVSPPLSLERLRVYNRITEIDFSDLRLSFDEARTFIKMQNVNISGQSLMALYSRTEGWIIGLQLFCFSLKRNPDFNLSEALKFGGPTNFSPYLEAEVLSQLPVELVDFMVKIASCYRFNAQFSAFLTQSNQVEDFLQQLDQENIFIQPLDINSANPWYRFHPLMRTALLERFAQLPAAEIKALNQRACQWLLDHQMTSEAVRHAIYAHEYAMAADLIGACGREMLRLGQIKTLLAWDAQIPTAISKDALAMQYAIIWALMGSNRYNEANDRMQQLEDSGQPFAAQNQVELKMLQCHFFIWKDDSQGILQTAESVNDFGDDVFLSNFSVNARSLAYCHIGDYTKARDIQFRVAPKVNSTEQTQRKVIGEIFIGLSFAMQGDMLQAEQSYRKALAVAIKAQGKRSELAGYAASFLSEVLYEIGAWEEGREQVSSLLDIIDYIGLPDGVMRSYVALIRIARQTAQMNEAKSYIETLEDIGVSKGLDRLLAAALYEGILLALQENNVTKAEEYLRRIEGVAVPYADSKYCAFAEIPIFAQMARLRHQFYMQQWHEVEKLAATLLPIVKTYKRQAIEIQIELVLVLTLDKQGQHTQALDKLTASLNTCMHLALQRTLLDEGEPLLLLIYELLRNGKLEPSLQDYIKTLVKVTTPLIKSHSTNQVVSKAPLVESLSKRELDLLSQLPQAFTNKKLALLLGISSNTVKWHLKNIYGKLGVVSRDEAVARARALKLISD